MLHRPRGCLCGRGAAVGAGIQGPALDGGAGRGIDQVLQEQSLLPKIENMISDTCNLPNDINNLINQYLQTKMTKNEIEDLQESKKELE